MNKIEQLREAVREKYGDDIAWGKFNEHDLDEIVTSTAIQAVEECIELADKIELSEPDGGTKQWMAFKRFRNTMRDKLQSLKQTRDND